MTGFKLFRNGFFTVLGAGSIVSTRIFLCAIILVASLLDGIFFISVSSQVNSIVGSSLIEVNFIPTPNMKL